MEYEEATLVRGLSKRLFGALYRLEVIAQVEPGRAFSLIEMSTRIGAPPSISSLQKELKLLCVLGMLTPQPPMPGTREQFYVAAPSPLWEASREMVRQASAAQGHYGLTSTQGE